MAVLDRRQFVQRNAALLAGAALPTPVRREGGQDATGVPWERLGFTDSRAVKSRC